MNKSYKNFLCLFFISVLIITFIAAYPSVPNKPSSIPSNQEIFTKTIPSLPELPTSDPTPSTKINSSCIKITYTNWSTCFSNGIQNRTELSRNPFECNETAILNKTCNYTASLIINQVQNTTPVIANNSFNSTPASELQSNQTLDQDEQNKKEMGASKKFFIKLICKLSHLFNKEEYITCIAKY